MHDVGMYMSLPCRFVNDRNMEYPLYYYVVWTMSMPPLTCWRNSLLDVLLEPTSCSRRSYECQCAYKVLLLGQSLALSSVASNMEHFGAGSFTSVHWLGCNAGWIVVFCRRQLALAQEQNVIFHTRKCQIHGRGGNEFIRVMDGHAIVVTLFHVAETQWFSPYETKRIPLSE